MLRTDRFPQIDRWPVGLALPVPLPDDADALKALLQAQHGVMQAAMQAWQAQVEQRLQADYERRYEERVQRIYEQLRLARRRLFGPSSESHAGQGWLFDEAEAQVGEQQAELPDDLPESVPMVAQSGAAEPGATESDTAATPRRRGKRQRLPAELPRVDVIHEIPENERTCACGTAMVEIGAEVSEQLDIVPMQIRVLRHIRKRYGCPSGVHAPLAAPVPAQVLPKSNASNDLLAMLLTTKYVDGLPLARFEYVLGRAGVIVPRQTLARWVIATARALQPIANLLRDTLLDATVIHMDETPVQVLKEAGRAATSQSYMWVQRGGPPGQPVVLFDYDPSRSGQVPRRLLAGWCGYLMTDGYDAYNAVVAQERIDHLACWVHVRRRFVDAGKVQAKGKRGRADHAIALIGQLYRIEREVREKTAAERFAARQAHSLPVLTQLRHWLDEVLPLVPPKTALGEALAYLHAYWPRLRSATPNAAICRSTTILPKMRSARL